jgi:uncharacterized protein
MTPVHNNYECDDDPILSPEGKGETIGSVINRRLTRRDFLQMATLSVMAAAVGAQASPAAAAEANGNLYAAGLSGATAPGRALAFKGIKPITSSSAKPVVAAGYKMQVLLRWGDPITSDAPKFDPTKLTAAAQEKQFGYNNDFCAFFPIDDSSTHGVIGVNHEYTNPELMWSKWSKAKTTKEMVDVELAAHGVSFVEIEKDSSGTWKVNLASEYNRRITGTTPMVVDGPAAGSDWLKTNDDPTGNNILGTLNNCAGGKTPWGTYLTAEENFHQYFGVSADLTDEVVIASHARYGVPVKTFASDRAWEKFYERFDVTKEPNEPFRHGWIVEIDPFDPDFVPVKHTALGRFRHEGATFAVNPDGKVVFYSGDDNRFDYAYKFVSEGTFDPSASKAENAQLFSEGTLYVAKFNDDGTGEWMPMIFGEGPLTEANGFTSQGDVLINARLAADLLEPTKMDRPEDVEFNPVNKKVYMLMTNNTNRGADGQPGVDAANPRPKNATGHVIELTEDGDDVASTTFTWEMFMLCGDPKKVDPANPSTEVYFAGFDPSKVSPIACPDNLTFDKAGNLWIATDGAPSPLRFNDGFFAVPVEGPNRGELKQFFSGVQGGEVVGPEFTPDDTTLFIGIQHPAEGSLFHMPSNRWPDNNRRMPPRPSVIAIQHENGEAIGSI